jgi:hypothetical protein
MPSLRQSLGLLFVGLPLMAVRTERVPAPQADASRFQYAAKIVCSSGREPIGLVPQQYATTINVHNPTDSLARIMKKIALTVPPRMQRPGRIMPLTREPEALRPDEAMATDCEDVAKRAGIAPVFEGFVVIYSSVPLDVVGVYSTPGGVDVEPVAERPRRMRW